MRCYYCPQLYKYDADKKPVPLQGEEIGKFVAKAVQNGVVEKQPWYPPSEMLPRKPIVDGKMANLICERHHHNTCCNSSG